MLFNSGEEEYYNRPKALEEEAKLYLDIKSTNQKGKENCHGRYIVYPRDIAIIFGDKRRSFAHDLIMKIREKSGLHVSNSVDYWEFCEYTGLDEEMVKCWLEESYIEFPNHEY